MAVEVFERKEGMGRGIAEGRIQQGHVMTVLDTWSE